MKTITLAVMLIIFVSFSANVYAHDPEAAPPRTCTGAAEFSFISTGGNTDTQSIGLGGIVECKPGLWSYLAKGAFIRSEVDDVENAKSIDTLFRASREISPTLKGYGQFGYYQNEFAGIENRYSLEAGLAYLLFTSPEHNLQIDGGFGYTNEDRVPPVTGEPFDDSLSFATARIGGSYRWKISETAEFGEDAGITFNLSDGSDWRFTNGIFITANLNRIFALKLSHALTYLNEPVPGFGKTDTVISAAVVAKF